MNKFTLHKMLGGKATIQIPELTQFSAIFRWTLMAAVALIPQMVQAQWHATVGAQGPEKGHQALAISSQWNLDSCGRQHYVDVRGGRDPYGDLLKAHQI